MKHILTITDKDITGSEKLSCAEPRIAVNAVLFDADGNIALSYMGKYELHTLPGGGVESDEDLYAAIKREVWEETGCECEIVRELGQIIENRFEQDFTQERSYYIARVVGKKGSLHLTDKEIVESTTVVWLSPEQAMKIIAEKQHDNYRHKFIQKRDTAALTEALTWLHLHDLPDYDMFVKIEPISKGLSNDKKYYVETVDNRRMLLRLTDTKEFDRKKAEYGMMEQVYELGVLTPEPYSFGLCDGGKTVYSLSGWLEGEDIESALPRMNEAEQYDVGKKAGTVLRKIHTLPAPDDAGSWDIRFRQKIETRVDLYIKHSLESENGEKIVKYLHDRQDLLENRPQTFWHGDFSIGNLLIMPDGEIGVIDFNYWVFGHGDPWWEFIAIPWGEEPSPHYLTGMINGYFDNSPPYNFFELLSYYFACDALSALCYTFIGLEPCKPEDGRQHMENILRWFDSMKNPVPTWYLKGFYVQWTDGVPYKLKAPFDFSFLGKYGKVFKVFDNQGSGNICFGIANAEKRYFVKFAGAPTENYAGVAKNAIERLKRAIPAYRDLAHPNLIKLINAEEIGNGYAVIFDWVDAVHMWTPDGAQEFKKLPMEKHHQIYDEILSFHAYMAEKEYCALDFYEDHIMWDVVNEKAVICDIDFYSKGWYEGMSGIWNTDCEWYSPEQHIDGASIDEISCVYAMGATAFALFGDGRDRCIEKWKLNEESFAVAKKAVSGERGERQQSIQQLMEEWRAAK